MLAINRIFALITKCKDCENEERELIYNGAVSKKWEKKTDRGFVQPLAAASMHFSSSSYDGSLGTLKFLHDSGVKRLKKRMG